MSKLKATGTRILIEKVEESRTTAGGIVLQHSQEVPKAKILSVGPQVKEDVAVGNIIVVDWSKVGVFNFENEKQYVVDESTVLAVLE
jgi:co-chaperonin GroES (HSP10)